MLPESAWDGSWADSAILGVCDYFVNAAKEMAIVRLKPDLRGQFVPAPPSLIKSTMATV